MTASPCNQVKPRMVAYIVKVCRITDILDHICDPAQDGTYPQKDGEAPHHLLEELDNLWSLLGWWKGIGPIPSQDFCSFDAGKTLKKPRKTHRETNSWSSCFVNCPGPWESEWYLVLPIPTFFKKIFFGQRLLLFLLVGYHVLFNVYTYYKMFKSG